MSVLIVTSLGDITVDLHTDKCPLTCKNFLKLCKIKYYNGCLFHTVQKDFTAQAGDPTGTGKGGDSVYKFLYGDQARFFSDEIHLDLKHTKMGTVAMASAGENLNASQFYFTLRDELDYLDGKHTVFGEVAEGLDTLTRINEAYVDEKSRPYKNIRIKHTYILDDPFDDPAQLAELIPDASPEGKPREEVEDEVRLEDDWVPLDEQVDPTELEEIIRAKEAHSSAVVLETIGDIPEAEIKPPENVLFVCKLNPVTEDEDLHTIFSRFGTVVSADIIRDYKTGDSLCYAFIEFETKEACEQAYFKMDNALIDDRRVHVDFSQSVSRLWSQFRGKDKNKGKDKGCFKCGAPDHFAKDCTGESMKQQPAKYILKEDNVQHGGDDSRYDMIFDEDMPESQSQVKRHRGRDVGDNGKMNKRIQEDIKLLDKERDSSKKHRQRPAEDDYRHRERSSHRDEDNYRHRERNSRRESRRNQDVEASHKDRRRAEQDYREDQRHRERGTDSWRRRDEKLRDYRDNKRSEDDRNGRDRRDSKSYKNTARMDHHADKRAEFERKDRRLDDSSRNFAHKDRRSERRDDRNYTSDSSDDRYVERRVSRESRDYR